MSQFKKGKELKNEYLLIYQKNDLNYKRIMDCRIVFNNYEDIEEFVKQLKKDINVINYMIVSKECYFRDKDLKWKAV